MTLNTLSIDPRRTWKGPWRWWVLAGRGLAACWVPPPFGQGCGDCRGCRTGARYWLGCKEARVCRHLRRRFHEEMLDCCHPLSKVREEGITLTQVCAAAAADDDFARVAEQQPAQPARTF